ncbi:Trehalose-phosphatase, partial [Globisporangium splendens]
MKPQRRTPSSLRINALAPGEPQTAVSPPLTQRPTSPSSLSSRPLESPMMNRKPKTVLIVVNVLPLVFARNTADTAWVVEWSSSATSMFYRNLVSETDKYSPLFIGCPEVFIAKSEEAAVEKQLRAFHCVPVFLDPTVAHRYFQGFCKGVLWPVFHNVVDVYNSAKLTLDEYVVDREESGGGDKKKERRESSGTNCWRDPASWNPAAQDKCWSDYCSVNRTFAKRIIESYHDGDLIWIHDFHFLMLPSYLLRKVRTALVAIYLHVPFPSSEIFRCLAVRTEILRAMLCADHIGFLIFEHARHFLTSCKRLLGLNYTTSQNGMLVIEYNGRKINISCSHIEPDVSHLHDILEHVDGDKDALSFKKKIEEHLYDGDKKRKFVIASVDRLEGLTALPLKLRAFDRFLSLHPDKRKSVVLVQIGLSLDSRPNDYHQTREYVVKFAAEINRRWAPPGELVVYFEEKVKTTCVERMNLWSLSDMYLDTCMRSGLSLLPFEYIVAQKHKKEHIPDSLWPFGSMVVSEFASYSRILNGCLLVNPWKTDDIVNALVKATEMNYYERHNRFQLNYKFLMMHSEQKWAERLLSDVESAVCKKQATEARETIDVGFGFDYRVMQFESGFVQLDLDDLVKKCTRSCRRLFVLDYGGTLSWTTSILDEDGAASYHRNGSVDGAMAYSGLGDRKTAFGQSVIRYIDGQVRTPLSDEARDNIRTLCSDPQNIVFVSSTGRRAELDAEFASIENLNLISDNGFFLKKTGSTQWECLYKGMDLNLDWKDEVKRIMQSFAARTNGAYLIVNEVSLIYDYRSCDPEYGEIQSLELYEQLRQVLKKGDATVYRGKGFVEVHQFGVNKATAMMLILSYMKEKVGVPDFVFFAGDDESDELAFKALLTFAERESALEHVFTCTVGMKPSCAKFYVDSVSDILAAVHAISVRLRLESSRPTLFSRQSYFDQFVAQGPLVSPRFIRSLSVETDGTELLDALVPPTPSESNDTFALPQPSATATPAQPLGPLASLTSLVPSCLAPHISSEWVVLGAAVGVGCALGASAISVHGKFGRFKLPRPN